MLQELLDGGSAEIKVREEMDYGDFSLNDAGQFWSLLVYTGYLTLEKEGQTAFAGSASPALKSGNTFPQT